MFDWLTRFTLWPLAYEQFTRIPKWAWFTYMGVCWTGGISMMAFVVIPIVIEERRFEIVESVLPGCWQFGGERRIAFFYELKTREFMSQNIVYLYQFERGETIEHLESRGITSFSPRLTEMYVDRQRPPWMFETEGGGTVLIEPANDNAIRIGGSELLETGIWSRCEPQPERNWRFRVQRYA